MNSDGLLEKENERIKETDCEKNKENARREDKDKEGHKDQHDESRVVVIQNEEKKGKDNEEERKGHKDQNQKSRHVIDGIFPQFQTMIKSHRVNIGDGSF